MKRIAIIFILIFAGVNSFAIDFIYNDIHYGTYTGDSTVYVSYYYNGSSSPATGNMCEGDVVIPEKVYYKNKEYKVRGIGYMAFVKNDKMTSITLPNTITSIGSEAFSGCKNLQAVYISDLVAWCNIKFSDNPLYKAHYLYLNGNEIKDLIIPNGITRISKYAFGGCLGLRSIYLPTTIQEIEEYAFDECNNVENIYYEDGSTTVFNMGNFNVKKFEIPSSVTNIQENALRYETLDTIVVRKDRPISINENVFLDETYQKATLIVPEGKSTLYYVAPTWIKFQNIKEYLRVKSISLSQTSLNISIGNSVELIASVLPENATYKKIIWSCSDDNIASIIDGIVLAKSEGRAIITASATDGSNVSISCEINVVKNHQFVDLGLPSGTLWATCNVGANSPEECGDYFAWGETSGYIDGKNDFDWGTYKYCEGRVNTSGICTSLTKYFNSVTYGNKDYIDNKIELDPEDDAAHVNWAELWRMPTAVEQQELVQNCTFTWTENYNNKGVAGMIVTGKNGGTIFLPVVGYRSSSGSHYSTMSGEYWSSSLSNSVPTDAFRLHFDSSNKYCYPDNSNAVMNRCRGIAVRPVISNIIKVTNITLSQNQVNLRVSESFTITATVLPEKATIKTLEWKSSDESIVTVDNGVITAVSEGAATITVSAIGGIGISATCKVNVVNKNNVALNPNIPYKMKHYSSNLYVDFEHKSTGPDDGNVSLSSSGTNVYFNYTEDGNYTISSNENSSGKFLGASRWNAITVSSHPIPWQIVEVEKGKYTLYQTSASYDGYLGSDENTELTALYVNKETPQFFEFIEQEKPKVLVSDITLNTESVKILMGETYSIIVNILPENATNKILEWESSDEGVATVNDGLVTPVGEGTATITVSATDGSGVSATCIVTVNKQESEEHEYVDLGLPSGTMWATRNVGASSDDSWGSYFSWGEVETKKEYRLLDYKYRTTTNRVYSKYNSTDKKTVLDPEDDVAHELWGGDWRMPTIDEARELIENCTITYDGNTCIFTGKNGNSIKVLPGGYFGYNILKFGYLSLGTCSENGTFNHILITNGSDAVINAGGGIERYAGLNVRPVFVKKDNTPIIKFADANVKKICVDNWDINGDGELSEAEAASVTDLDHKFCGNFEHHNTSIVSFDELKYFTGLTNIDYQFRYCENLKNIIIPENVSDICSYTFEKCNSLEKIVLPKNLKSIGENAFRECLSLKSITIPDSVSSIGANAFISCSSLESINIPKSLSTISEGMFYYCNNLKQIYIPSNVTAIDDDAFSQTGIIELELPKSITKLGGAFVSCKKIKKVKINWDTPPQNINSDVFSNSGISYAKLYVPTGTKSVFQTAAVWKDFKEIVEMDEIQHEYVDLGLTSGTLWATTNVGAYFPEEYGNYYAWGETEGYYDGKTYFGWENYKYCDGKNNGLTKYCNDVAYGHNGFVDDKKILEEEDDIASVLWGKDWRIPTKEEFNELISNCVWTWTNNYNNTVIKGYIITGPNNNTIFLPASGIHSLNSIDSFETGGNYWSSTLKNGAPDESKGLEFNNTKKTIYDGYGRSWGLSVRPVYKGENIIKVTNITLDKKSINIKINDKTTIVATVFPENAKNKKLFWKSTNESVATVDDGLVTAKSLGETLVIATTTDGTNLSDTCHVTVVPEIQEGDEFEVEGVRYEVSSLEPAEVKVVANNYNGDITIPVMVNYTKEFTVTSFSDDAFLNCSDLKSLKVGWNNPLAVSNTCFAGIALSNVLLNVPEGKYEAYHSADVWKNFGVINDGNYGVAIKNNSLQITYTGKAPEFELENKNVLTLNWDKTQLKRDAGVYTDTIPATFSKGTITGSIDLVFKYTIIKAELKVKPEGKSREYGAENPVFTTTYEGLVNNETNAVITTKPQLTTTAVKTSKVGTYPITAKGANAKNYYFTYEQGTLNVTKAPLSVKADDKVKEYGADNPTLTATYSGWKNGETETVLTAKPTITTTATKSSPIGTYPITASGGSALNYEFTEYVPGVLTVANAVLTITANNATRVYGDDNPTFTYKVTGLKSGDTESVITKKPTFNTTANRKSDVGSYDVMPQDAVATNYSINYVKGVLTVTKSSLTITADNKQRVYGEENPELTASYAGFKNGETSAVLTAKPHLSTTATVEDKPGKYQINITGATAQNYNVAMKPGTLTIEKAPQTITWDDDLSSVNLYDGVVFLEISASSGLDVQLETEDENIANVFYIAPSWVLSPNGAGKTTIVASQAGNDCYLATELRKNVRVYDPDAIAGLELSSSKENVVYTINGQKVGVLKADEITTLPKGIYIINGKKRIVK